MYACQAFPASCISIVFVAKHLWQLLALSLSDSHKNACSTNTTWPGQGTGSWRTRHVQSHYRLSTALSPDPVSVKSHALFAPLNYLILNVHFISCHTSFASSEFIVELLVREITGIFVCMPSISCILYLNCVCC